ncbi:MAG TPA: hypothetical protein VMB51_01030 [Solirubrobacteraceae bacterium]|nr:hypothetical protein [Solirubrobacteraceae bacterium]
MNTPTRTPDPQPTSMRTATDGHPRAIASRAPAPAAAKVCALLAALAGVAVLALDPDAHIHALDAAGAFNGTPISGVQNFVEKLKGNLVWLGGTGMGLIIAVVAIMFMAGHSRAHDLAIRTIIGLAILASISGIIA